jgi:hypothetical protein
VGGCFRAAHTCCCSKCSLSVRPCPRASFAAGDIRLSVGRSVGQSAQTKTRPVRASADSVEATESALSEDKAGLAGRAPVLALAPTRWEVRSDARTRVRGPWTLPRGWWRRRFGEEKVQHGERWAMAHWRSVWRIELYVRTSYPTDGVSADNQHQQRNSRACTWSTGYCESWRRSSPQPSVVPIAGDYAPLNWPMLSASSGRCRCPRPAG